MKSSKILVVAVLAMMMASAALAQRGDGGGQRRGGGQRGGFSAGGGQRGGMMQRGGGMSEATLLSRDDVKKDIKLTDEQKKKLETLQTESMAKMRTDMEEMREGGSFDRDAMMEYFTKSQKESETKAKEILTKEQWTRLGEIKVQLMGSRAVMDEEIAKKLILKASQKLQISNLNDALSAANRQIGTKMRDQNVDREALGAEITKNNELYETELAKILTAGQKRKLDAMKGKPFKADPNQQSFGGRGGRDGGGGRRGGGGGGGG